MALLKAEHITKTYGQRTIIKDINIELHQGGPICRPMVSHCWMNHFPHWILSQNPTSINGT